MGGVTLLGTNSALADFNKIDLYQFDNNDQSRSEISNKCQRLLELENKVNLSDRDSSEGTFLHDLILQVSEEPLEYCHLVSASKSRSDTGHIFNINYEEGQ